MSELKPCPFCGSAVSLRPLLTEYQVICTRCSGMMGYGTAKNVIASWNKRAHKESVEEPKLVSYADYVCVIDKYFKAVDEKMDLTAKYIAEQAKCIDLRKESERQYDCVQEKLIDAHKEIEQLRAFNTVLRHALGWND